MANAETTGEPGYVREQLGRIDGKLDGLVDTMRRAADAAERREEAVQRQFDGVRHRSNGLHTLILAQDSKWELRFAEMRGTQDERHRDNLAALDATRAQIAKLSRPVHQFVRLRERWAGIAMVLGAVGAVATTLSGLLKPAWDAAWEHVVARWFGG